MAVVQKSFTERGLGPYLCSSVMLLVANFTRLETAQRLNQIDFVARF